MALALALDKAKEQNKSDHTAGFILYTYSLHNSLYVLAAKSLF